MSYNEKCPTPIPIGKQRYAYQCENIAVEPIHGAIDIRGWPPSGKGKEPYPNPEKDTIANYDLKIERFTGNSITICFVKKHTDGAEDTFLTTLSFSELVNRIFEDKPANIFHQDAPIKRFEP